MLLGGKGKKKKNTTQSSGFESAALKEMPCHFEILLVCMCRACPGSGGSPAGAIGVLKEGSKKWRSLLAGLGMGIRILRLHILSLIWNKRQPGREILLFYFTIFLLKCRRAGNSWGLGQVLLFSHQIILGYGQGKLKLLKNKAVISKSWAWFQVPTWM